jgi:hypothetical protein
MLQTEPAWMKELEDLMKRFRVLLVVAKERTNANFIANAKKPRYCTGHAGRRF